MTTPITITDVAARVHADILANGGATWAPGKNAPTEGYMVSRPDAEIVIPLREFTVSDVLAYMELFRLERAEYYGAWVHEGRVYLDISRNYSDRATAEIAGIVNGQLAIWDVANEREIPLK